MFPLKIAHKLFIAILLITATGIGILAAAQRYTFQQGFLEYAQEVELDRLQPFIDGMAAIYADQGNWEWLNGRERFTGELLRRIRAQQERRPLRERLNRDNNRSNYDLSRETAARILRMARSQNRLWQRLTLVDTDGRWVAGQPLMEGSASRAIEVNESVVGYIRLAPIENLTADLDVSFAKQQRQTIIWAAFAVFLVAAAMALLFSRYFGRSMQVLTNGVSELSRGNYQSQIPIPSKDELGQLAEDVNRLARALDDGRRQRQQWVADIAHELRTPITVLRGELEAMQDGVRPFNEQALMSLQGEVLRLNRLVDDLHQLSQADAGQLHCEFRPISLASVLNDALGKMAPRLAEKSLTLTNDAEDVVLLADEQRLHQLLLNVLENSVRYTGADGQLRLTATREGHSAVIVVEDSAPGVPAEALPYLFDRLYRVDPSRSRETGAAGLGLAIVAAIVNAHGGNISARPSELGGLAIELSLPCAE